MISQELARELKVAQLPWRPRRGDLVMDRLNIAFIVLKDGTDEDGAVEIDTPHGVERRPFLGLTWIPRADQLLTFLERWGALTITTARSSQEGGRSRWQLTLHESVSEPAGGKSFSAADLAEAAGAALHHLLGTAGWNPGRAL